MHPIVVRHLNVQPYTSTWHAMRDFTHTRTQDTFDEFWIVEHPAVFTQGQAGKPEHLLAPSEIPVVQTDRGGQITYHGPGQLLVYVLLDLRRKNMTVTTLVSSLENAIIATLAEYGIQATGDHKARGVYVAGAKIGALGLRIRHGCCYHGLSLNVDMDLTPFRWINPCGHRNLKVTQISDFYPEASMATVESRLVSHLSEQLGIDYRDIHENN